MSVLADEEADGTLKITINGTLQRTKTPMQNAVREAITHGLGARFAEDAIPLFTYEEGINRTESG